MPSSHPHQLNEIAEMIMVAQPASMLDVGIGFGKYGFLAREYLEVWDGKNPNGEWTHRIDGIEACKEYILDHHKIIYDNLYFGDALEILPTLQMRYDLLLASDILEHFDRDRGLKFLQACLARARNVIISTPHDSGKQMVESDNPFETHRSEWAWKDFAGFPNKFHVANDVSLIVFIGEDATKIYSRLRYVRLSSRLKRCFPRLKSLARALKGRKS
jgi:hypothetical protein